MASQNDTQLVPAPHSSTSSNTSTQINFSIKLTSRNYLTWKTQFITLLNYHKLTGFIDGLIIAPSSTITSTDTPPQTTPNPEFSEWF